MGESESLFRSTHYCSWITRGLGEHAVVDTTGLWEFGRRWLENIGEAGLSPKRICRLSSQFRCTAYSSQDVGHSLPVTEPPWPPQSHLQLVKNDPLKLVNISRRVPSDFTQLWQTVSQQGLCSSSAEGECYHDGPYFRSGAQLLFVLTTSHSLSGTSPSWNLATKVTD